MGIPVRDKGDPVLPEGERLYLPDRRIPGDRGLGPTRGHRSRVVRSDHGYISPKLNNMGAPVIHGKEPKHKGHEVHKAELTVTCLPLTSMFYSIACSIEWKSDNL